MGKNSGKKYVKLKGNEIATPANEARANEFLRWYGDNVKNVRTKLRPGQVYDDEVATDTMLMVYDNIAYKGAMIQNYLAYFLMSYHTNYIAAMKRVAAARNIVSFKIKDQDHRDYDREDINKKNDETRLWVEDKLIASTFDYEAYEQTVDHLKTVITDYVRANYDPAACSLFEIYIGLQPDISYERLAGILGMRRQDIWPVLGAIRKDLINTFRTYKDFLLSQV